MGRIGLVGDKNSALAFRAFGFEVCEAAESSPEKSQKIVDKMAREGFGLIFVTEQIANTIAETIDRYSRQLTPAIVLIPGNTGSLGFGMERLRSNVEKAVGINILD